MVCGLGIQAVPHNGSCEEANAPNDESQGNKVDDACDPNAKGADARGMRKIKQAENKKGWTYLGPTITGMNMKQTAALAKIMASSESDFVVTVENKGHYLGEFQMGAAALIEAGLVKRGTSNNQLDDPSRWLNGLSKTKFLNDRQLQHNAWAAYTNSQIKQLGNRYTGAKNIYDKFGAVAAAHLLGPAGSRKLTNVDANGVTGNSYYDMAAVAAKRWLCEK